MHKWLFWYIIIFSVGTFCWVFFVVVVWIFLPTKYILFFYLAENKSSVVRNRKQGEPNCSGHQKNQCERCLPEPNLDS